MIVILAADGIVVQDADDLDALRLRTELGPAAARVALQTTGSGALVGEDCAGLDLAVLRSRAKLLSTAPDWAARWAAMVERAERGGRLTEDRRSVRVPIER
ncbi:hypothetical protein [Pseudonocardia humida]|uniref:Uncharacterized protein n=1 Tax=Pseudonocardia humida TaxID=2800819 RepID=A0ABT0ZYH2_9PSEU|nr:hypothetical protein [Pseudonocardia humida]MCO1655792.1 hypothetical protein [Pseudonocardia humida]